MTDRSQKTWLTVVVFVVLILAAGAFFFEPLRETTWRLTRFLADLEGARAWIQGRTPYSELVFIGLCVLQVVISPIPGELACLLGGFVFGWGEGFLYSSLGLTIGSAINVSVGRLMERALFERFVPARLLDRFEDRTRRYGLFTVLILFLFPGAPKDLFCYLFGLTRIPIGSFLLVSSLARMPGTLVLTIQGDNVFRGDWRFFLLITLGSTLILGPVLYCKNRIMTRLGFTEPRP